MEQGQVAWWGSPIELLVVGQHLRRLSGINHLPTIWHAPQTSPPKNSFTGTDLWGVLASLATPETIWLSSRQDSSARHWLESDFPANINPPTENSVHSFSPLLTEFIHEAQSDTVEFRRLMRRSLRPLKSRGARSLLCLDIAWGERRTQQIIQQLLGPQRKFISAAQALSILHPSPTQQLHLYPNQLGELDWLKFLAEKWWRTKLPQDFFGKS